MKGIRDFAIGAAIIVATLTGGSIEARAQGPNEDRRTALYRDGVALADAGRWSEAVVKFREVVAIRPAPKALVTLGQAEEKVGRPASAAKAYRSALAAARATEPDVAKVAEDSLAAVEPKAPRVRLFLSKPMDAQASIDGAAVVIGEPVEIDPGDHRLVVRAVGMRELAADIKLAEGERLAYPVVLEPLSAPPRSDQPEAIQRTSAMKPVAVVVAGVGLVGIGVGSGLALEAIAKKNQSDSAGCKGDDCPGTSAQIRYQARTFGDAATVAFIAGGALVAGGVALWFLAPSRQPATSTGALQLTPTVGVGAAGLSAQGRF